MKLVSIIVPVYNVEKYIEDCITSLLNQSYKNIEILLVDDGSTDNSPNIIDEFGQIDSRIKVFHLKNSGVSSARNFGINNAKGEFLVFVDSDDTVAADFVESLYLAIDSKDIAICGYKLKYINKNIDIISKLDFSSINKIDLYKDIFTSNDIAGFSCNKMFNKSTLDKYNIRFKTNLSICEDLLFVCEYLSRVSSFAYVAKPLYIYRMRKGSATAKKSYNKCMSELMAYDCISKLNLPDEVRVNLDFRRLKVYYKSKNFYSKLDYKCKDLLKNEKNIVSKFKLNEKIKFYILKFKLYNSINYLRNRFLNLKFFD